MPAKKVAAVLKRTPAKTAKPKPTTAVAVRQTGAVSTEFADDFKARMIERAAKARKEVAKAPGASGASISFRGGIMKYQGRTIGHELSCAILAPQFIRTFYEDAFDLDNIVSPVCFSFDNVAPHEKSVKKQSDSCATCPMSAFKSAPNGKGKACKEQMRLGLIPITDVTDADEIAQATIAQVQLSVMNAKDARPVLDEIYDTYGHTIMCSVELTCNPDGARQILNTIEVEDALEPAIVEALEKRVNEAEAMLLVPYEATVGEAAPISAGKRPMANRRTKY